MRAQERIEELEQDRDGLLETLTRRMLGDLDNLTGNERAWVYRMLRLEVSITPQGGYRLRVCFVLKNLRGRPRTLERVLR